MFIKRVVRAAGGALEAPLEDPTFLKAYPAIAEYMTVSQWEDGKPRKLSTMSWSFQEGRWCVCFVDKDSNRLAFLSSETFTDLLKALEKRLSSDSMEWRPCKSWSKKS
jgi:hypothetical protein